jgi:hypothetical protein
MAAGVAACGFGYAFYFAKSGFYSPETACAENYFFFCHGDYESLNASMTAC